MITITPQQFSAPPPYVPNMSVPPPGFHPQAPPPQRFHAGQIRHNNYFPQFRPQFPRNNAFLDPDFDGKRLRKSTMRKTVDYNAAIIKMLEGRIWQRDYRDRIFLQPDAMYNPELLPPPSYPDNAVNAVTTRFVKTATNKMRCPVFCMAWTPEGRRLVTGTSSGEFTLWNGLTFNFETILQAHDSPVRTMVWSNNDSWMVTADHTGYIKYWQSNMNNIKMFPAHKEAIRGISFSSSDEKFASCSDDGTIRIWDFYQCQEERILRGHGADVKCIDWHPQKGLIISGSKDNQQPIKLWDPKTGQALATLHAHKNTVMDIKWNKNGNWLITASRDHLLKLFDIRNLSTEVQTFRGHKKESSCVSWHPYHEGLFCSGGSDGAILFWHVGADKEVGAIEQAHDSIVWTLAWHPLGHILCSGSNDHTSKFWTRNRPGDQMKDKYNLNTLPQSLAGFEDNEIDDIAVIPGMGPEDKVAESPPPVPINPDTIPGLDVDPAEELKLKVPVKKVPYSKPIPKQFQAQWNVVRGIEEIDDSAQEENPEVNVEDMPGAIPISEVEPDAIVIYGRLLPVKPGSALARAIREGKDSVMRLAHSGAIPQLLDVLPYDDDTCFDNFVTEDPDQEFYDESNEEAWNSEMERQPRMDEDFRMHSNQGFSDEDMRMRPQGPFPPPMYNGPPMYDMDPEANNQGHHPNFGPPPGMGPGQKMPPPLLDMQPQPPPGFIPPHFNNQEEHEYIEDEDGNEYEENYNSDYRMNQCDEDYRGNRDNNRSNYCSNGDSNWNENYWGEEDERGEMGENDSYNNYNDNMNVNRRGMKPRGRGRGRGNKMKRFSSVNNSNSKSSNNVNNSSSNNFNRMNSGNHSREDDDSRFNKNRINFNKDEERGIRGRGRGVNKSRGGISKKGKGRGRGW